MSIPYREEPSNCPSCKNLQGDLDSLLLQHAKLKERCKTFEDRLARRDERQVRWRKRREWLRAKREKSVGIFKDVVSMAVVLAFIAAIILGVGLSVKTVTTWVFENEARGLAAPHFAEKGVEKHQISCTRERKHVAFCRKGGHVMECNTHTSTCMWISKEERE